MIKFLSGVSSYWQTRASRSGAFAGLDLVRQLREEALHIKTLVLTGSVDPTAEGLAREACVDEVLFKSASIMKIADARRIG